MAYLEWDYTENRAENLIHYLQALTKVLKIDINEHVEIAGQLLVFTVPTILIMYKGREVLRESRFIDFQRVERMLNSF